MWCMFKGRHFDAQHVATHLGRHVILGVKDSIHGVDVCEFHQRPIAQLAALVKLAPAEAGLKDVQGGHLRGGMWLLQMPRQGILASQKGRGNPGQDQLLYFVLTQTPREISQPASASDFAIAQPKPCSAKKWAQNQSSQHFPNF